MHSTPSRPAGAPAARRLPANWRDLLAVIAAATLTGTVMSFSLPLLALVLQRQGVPPALIGLNAAVTGLSVLALAPFLPRLARRFGAVRCMQAGLVIAAASFLLLPVFPNVWAWFPIRFAIGVGIMLLWVISESAINGLIEEHQRGRVMGLYATLFCVGFAAGPLLVATVGSEGILPFLLSAGGLLLGLLPVSVARNADAAISAPGSARLGAMLWLAPLPLATMFAFGFVETAQFSLLPLYGLAHGLGESRAALLLSVLIAGNVVLQLPLGWLADRVDRRRLLRTCVAASLLGLVLLPTAIGAPALLWPLLLLLGGTLGGLYTLTMTLIGERFKGADLAVANTAVVMMYEFGNVLGPSLGGAAMTAFGAEGLPLTLALALAALLMLRRGRA